MTECEKKDDQLLDAAFRGLVAHSLFEDEIYQDREVLRHRVLSRLRQSGRFDRSLCIDKFCDEIFNNLTNYRNSDTFKDATDEYYNEVSFETEVCDVRLFGVIDKLYRSKTDGCFRVLDFKTNAVSNLSQAANEVQKHRYDLQVQCYCLAAEKILGQQIKEARLFFSHIPSKECEIILAFDTDVKRNIHTNLSALADDIEAENYFALPSSSCQTCSYHSFCNANNC